MHAKYQSYEQPVKILWTGGWDSTFQLLRLLFIENRPVAPYYLINEDRVSTSAELLAMKRIRQGIGELNQSALGLVHPTTYFSVSQIPDNPRISNAYLKVKSTRFIGSQYDWLARFCEHNSITRLQLCIHEDDKAAAVVAPKIAKHSETSNQAVLDEQYFETAESMVFRYFEFPILNLTKTDMAQIAEQNGWNELMEMTWFCHTPANGNACGLCAPCEYTIEEGLAWRIPAHRRIVGALYRSTLVPGKKLAKRVIPPTILNLINKYR